MIEFRFEVNGQELRRIDRINPAGDVVGQLWAAFDFNDWWEDTFPIARFVKGGIIYDVEIINDRCLVPYQALSGEGKFYVSVYAIVSNGRKTTNKEVVEYITSGLNLSISPAPQEGTLWEKLYKSLRGGQTGQFLKKISDDDYASEWANITGDDITVDDETLQEVLTDVKSDISVLNASAGFDKPTANDTSYDNTISGLNGETVQEAIDELSSSLDSLARATLGDVTSWAKVQEIVRAGRADKVFNIGDQFTVMKGSTPLVFDVIGIDHDIPTDSTKTHSMTLQLHDCLMDLQFDAPEPTNPNTKRASYGSNNWLESGLRQWLNATGDDWWSAKTEHDVAPAYATTTAGFLSDIDSEFLSVIGNVKKITTQNTVTDGGGSVDSDEKIFLLSSSEVYGGDTNSINEGMAYPYYSDNSSLSSAGTGADVNRIKYLSGVARHWWLRSPSTSSAYHVRVVETDGAIWAYGANSSYGVAPACCII